jgi:hypothetical protein
MAEQEFDPYVLLGALERRRVSYVVIGALGRVLHGSGEVTDGLDICPSLQEENLRRLELALDDLDAKTRDGRRARAERDLVGRPVLELRTEAGELKLVPEPAGTRGYDDLRRRARQQPLGKGLWPRVGSVDDQARMLAVMAREQDRLPLQRLQRVIELGRERSRGLGIER